MNWIILAMAGLFEVAFAMCLGKARVVSGAAAYGWYAGFLICLVLSMSLLIKAAQTLPLGTAYAIWTGIGTVGTVMIGIFVFKDPVNLWRILWLIMLVTSILGLKFVSG